MYQNVLGAGHSREGVAEMGINEMRLLEVSPKLRQVWVKYEWSRI